MDGLSCFFFFLWLDNREETKALYVEESYYLIDFCFQLNRPEILYFNDFLQLELSKGILIKFETL